MKRDEFNIEYFKFIRAEIIKRIDIHYKLVLAKYAFTGSLFAYLLSKQEKVEISPFLLASIFSFLFDFIILENISWIRGAGKYIKEDIEDTNLPIMKWETDRAQLSGAWTCFSFWGYVAGVWGIGLTFYVGNILLNSVFTNELKIMLFVFNSLLLVFTLYLIFGSLGKKAKIKFIKTMSPVN